MARFNEILVGRFARGLQKLTGIKGAVPTPQLATEIVPSFSLFYGVENRVLEGWQRYATFVSLTATAGQTGAFRLRNPTGSNVVAVVEKITVTNTNASAQIFSVQQNYLAGIADFGAIIVCSGLDNRFNPTSVNNNLIASFANSGAAAQGSNIMQAGVAPGASWEFINFEDHEITQLQNGCIQVWIGAVNLAMNATLIWRERFLEDSERSV